MICSSPQKEEGLVIISMEGDVGAWDDDALVKAFNHALKSHRRTGDPPVVTKILDSSIQQQSTHSRGADSISSDEHQFPSASTALQSPNLSAATELDSSPETSPTAQFQSSSAAMRLGPSPETAPHILPNPIFPPKVDDEALNDLLLAWYYSGYYTGRYQAISELKRQQEHAQAK